MCKFQGSDISNDKNRDLAPWGGGCTLKLVFKLGAIIQPIELIVVCKFQASATNSGRNIKGAHFYKDGPLGPLLIKLQLSNSG